MLIFSTLFMALRCDVTSQDFCRWFLSKKSWPRSTFEARRRMNERSQRSGAGGAGGAGADAVQRTQRIVYLPATAHYGITSVPNVST